MLYELFAIAPHQATYLISTHREFFYVYATSLTPSKIAQSADKVSVITKAAIQVEQSVIMPEGADELGNYTRYYSLSDRDGKEIMIGIFVISDWDIEPNRIPIQGLSDAYFVESDQHLPIIMDGGCDVVTIYFDLQDGRLIEFTGSGIIATDLATCNGVA